MRRMHKLRRGGVAAAVGMATLVTPLLTIQSAQAATGSDLSITKTVASTKPPVTFDRDLRDVRVNGHDEWTRDGLHIWTEGSGDEDKVGEYVATHTPLAAVGEPSLEFLTHSGSIPPGFVLKVDVTGDGHSDGELIGETGYGNDWWLNDPRGNPGDFAAFQALAPVVGGGSGSPWHGTLAQWLANAPTATVTGWGFGLGSNVQGDYVMTGMTFANTHYDLVRRYHPSIKAAPGDTVEYQITVANGATGAGATGVSVNDVLPANLTPDATSLEFSGPDWCDFSGNTLSCTGGVLPTGSSASLWFKATVSGDLSTAAMQPTQGHWVDVQKQETFLEIPVSDHPATGTATCPAGYIPTDGGLLVDSVDQGGFYSDIVVDSSKPTAGNDGWTVTVENLGDARATGKVKVTCLKNELGSSNGHTHTLQVDSPAESTITSGSTKTVSCPSGDLPFAPRFEATGGIAVVRSSYATDNSWTWVIDREASASVTVGVNCLAPQSTEANGHTAPLDLTTATGTTTVGAEQRSDTVVLCPEVDGKRGNGIVGGYQSSSADLLSLGAESRGNNYMFRFWNDDYDTAQQSHLSLACIGVRTADEQPYILIRNTATVTDAAHDTATSSADLQVSGDAVTPTSGLTAIKAVLLTRAVNVRLKSPTDGAVSVKVLKGTNVAAKGSGTLPADTATTIKAKLNSFGASHLSVGDSVKIKVTIHGSTTTLGPLTLQ